MKNKFWVLITIAGFVIAVLSSCDDDPKGKDPVYCPDLNGNGHLGINENCIKDTGDCSGLQDYRTAAQKSAFPKPIYRYGKASNYTAAQLTGTAQNIVDAYTGIGGQGTKDNFIAKAGKVCIIKAENNLYTWDGVVFGVHVNMSTDTGLRGLMEGIDSIPNAGPINGLVQLQPARTRKGDRNRFCVSFLIHGGAMVSVTFL